MNSLLQTNITLKKQNDLLDSIIKQQNQIISKLEKQVDEKQKQYMNITKVNNMSSFNNKIDTEYDSEFELFKHTTIDSFDKSNTSSSAVVVTTNTKKKSGQGEKSSSSSSKRKNVDAVISSPVSILSQDNEEKSSSKKRKMKEKPLFDSFALQQKEDQMLENGGVSYALRGLNIQQPHSKLLLSGQKTIEIRKYPLSTYANEDLWLIETPGKVSASKRFEARITGIIRFDNSKKYATPQEYNNDIDKHLCEKANELANWNDNEVRYGWEVSKYIQLREPVLGPETKGVIGCKKLKRVVLIQNDNNNN